MLNENQPYKLKPKNIWLNWWNIRFRLPSLTTRTFLPATLTENGKVSQNRKRVWKGTTSIRRLTKQSNQSKSAIGLK